jgi:hypothetical protein
MMIGIIDGLQEITRSDIVLVTTTNKIVADARNTTPTRKVITIRNNSAAAASIITLSFGQYPAINTAGIILRQYESITDANDGAYECYQGQINAICADANGSLSVFER